MILSRRRTRGFFFSGFIFNGDTFSSYCKMCYIIMSRISHCVLTVDLDLRRTLVHD